MLGFFENGQPKILFKVKGSGEYKEIVGIIDSGFNGYLRLPYAAAFPLGLPLVGTGSGTVVDGGTSAHLICSGHVCIDGKCLETSIDVNPTTAIIIGTSLLKDLRKTLYIDSYAEKVEILESAYSPEKQGFAKLEIPNISEE